MWLRLGAVLMIVGFAAAARGQEAEPAAGSVEGVVVNQVTGEPIRRAVVRLFSRGDESTAQEPLAAMTGADGVFRYANLRPGVYQLLISRSGFLPSKRLSGYPAPGPESFELAPGQELTGLRCTLLPEAILSGRVLDDEGEPVQGAMVTALVRRFVDGQRRWDTNRADWSDDRGEFRIHGVPPGRVKLAAHGGATEPGVPLPSAEGEAEMSLAWTCYPSALAAEEGQTLDVKPGVELANLEIRLRRIPLYRVRGRALEAEGNPLAHAQMVLSRSEPGYEGPRIFAKVSNGAFELRGVTAGRWIVELMDPAAAGTSSWWSSTTEIEVGPGNVDDITIQVGSRIDVQGVLRIDSPAVKPPPEGTTISLSLAGDTRRRPAYVEPAKVAEDGTWTLKNVPAGRYWVDVTGPTRRSMHLAEFRAGDQTSRFALLDTTGGAPGRVILDYRTDSGAISGRPDLDGQEADGGILHAVLWPADVNPGDLAPPGVEKGMTTPAHTSFLIDRLRPGEYLLWLFEEYQYGALSDPDIFQQALPKATRVKVRAGETVSVQVKPVTIALD